MNSTKFTAGECLVSGEREANSYQCGNTGTTDSLSPIHLQAMIGTQLSK